ncbi:S-layer homology domain-containing protein [Acutalibacter sp. JLR.KK004]|uniref:CAP and S-layer homology domain-containing protein n=1 Tax=Acutalibacter sp. JLR.KK004 TaxID=3112622 RepID=UPI002FF1DF7E
MKRGKFFKKLLSMVLTAGMLFATLAGTAGAAGMGDFTDVSPKDWYYEAVEYAVENKLFSGTSSTEFSPETPMDRGMFVTVLGRLAGVSTGYGAGRENPFTDIRSGDYFYPYTLWAVDNGITGGTGNGKFSPRDSVNREQIAAFLHRYFQKFGFELKEQESPFGYFPDSGKASSFAVGPLKWATAYGIIGGSDGKLVPGGIATRCQVAQMLLNFSKIDAYKADGEAPAPKPGEDDGDKDPDNTPTPPPTPSPNPGDGDDDNAGTEPSPTPKPWENYNPTYTLPTGKSPVDENGGYYDYDLANEILRQVNELRVKEGLGELKHHPTIQKWAAVRAKEHSYGTIAHVRPDGSKWDTVGAKLHAENLVRSQNDPEYDITGEISNDLQASANKRVTAWLNSVSHRNAMFKDVDQVTGVAAYVIDGNVYVAQLFSQQNCYFYDYLMG